MQDSEQSLLPHNLFPTTNVEGAGYFVPTIIDVLRNVSKGAQRDSQA